MNTDTPEVSGGNKPPTSEARIEMFLNLADQYMRLTAPARSMDPENEDDWGTPEHRDALMLRAALLRKFVKKSDQLYVPLVLNDFYAYLEKTRGGVGWELIEIAEEIRINFVHALHFFEITNEEGETVNSSEAFDHIIYGSILHADYAKWVAVSGEENFFHTATLMHTVVVMEQVIQQTLALLNADWAYLSDLLPSKPKHTAKEFEERGVEPPKPTYLLSLKGDETSAPRPQA